MAPSRFTAHLPYYLHALHTHRVYHSPNHARHCLVATNEVGNHHLHMCSLLALEAESGISQTPQVNVSGFLPLAAWDPFAILIKPSSGGVSDTASV
jgi:hypothetical protein